MSKHVGVYVIERGTVLVYDCALVGCNKDSRIIFAFLGNMVEIGRGLFKALLWNLTGRDNSKIVGTAGLQGQGYVLRSSYCWWT